MDNQSEKRFKKVVKLLKRWNYEMENKEGETFKGFKSFHIEEIIKAYFIANGTLGTYDCLMKFFDEAIDFLAEPSFPDRADSTRFIDAYVAEISAGNKQKIVSHLEIARSLLSTLVGKTEEHEVIDLLEILLAMKSVPSFPKQVYVSPSYSPHYLEV